MGPKDRISEDKKWNLIIGQTSWLYPLIQKKQLLYRYLSFLTVECQARPCCRENLNAVVLATPCIQTSPIGQWQRCLAISFFIRIMACVHPYGNHVSPQCGDHSRWKEGSPHNFPPFY